ncbi:helix-turn-helix transcriptional regulator [Streptomyces sp. NPDC047014]|uniref:helix-turn-helix domain-containing protein n=1 Tax=Streptomyces sp. NPDC047014 TaxID=3155736 RepID=UPI0033D5EF8C
MGRETGETVTEAGDFARRMRELKERGGLSYGALARKLHTSTSTLHRYCNGQALPGEFAVVDRFARACGATPAEALTLHQAWLLAQARRQEAAGAGQAAGQAAGAGAAPERGPGGVPEREVVLVPEPGVRAEGGVRRGWWRRAGVAVVAVVVAGGLLAGSGPERGAPVAGVLPGAGGAVAAGGPSEPVVPPVSSGSGGPPAPSGPPPLVEGTPVPGETGGSAGATAPPAPGGTGAVVGPTVSPGPVLRAAVRGHVWAGGCDHAYLTERGPGSVAAPPVEADAPAWAAAQRAVHAGTQIVEVSVHGTGAGAVVLEGLEVRVTARRTPPAWNVFQMSQGCGGGLTPAVFAVNLDAPRPLARPVPGNDAGTRLPAPAFPLRVSAADPAVLRVQASTTGCDCDWYLELRWSAPSGSGVLRVDDLGRPLRTSAAPGRPVYGYATDQGRWVR